MELNHITEQIEALAQELATAKQEYDFARGRVQHHKHKALAGDMWASWYLAGAETKMQELQQTMNAIVESMAILEEHYSRMYFKQMMEGKCV